VDFRWDGAGKKRNNASGTRLHPVPGEVDAERGLGELRRDLLRGELHLPSPVGVAVQAQVLLIRVALVVKRRVFCAERREDRMKISRERASAEFVRAGRRRAATRGREARAPVVRALMRPSRLALKLSNTSSTVRGASIVRDRVRNDRRARYRRKIIAHLAGLCEREDFNL
jgi:hypothetical protein